MGPDVDRSTEVLDLRQVSKTFAQKGQPLAAVRDVSLTVGARECVALVGESGSGKTTLANMIVGLLAPTAGTIQVAGELDVVKLAKRRSGRRELAAQVQLVFQDPYGSLDPSKTIGSIVAEPLLLFGLTRQEIRDRVDEALTLVGMDVSLRRRRPRELSGGQRQRVGVARALAPRPSLLVLDEPVSALDVSVQGQVLSLLADVREQTGVAVLVIAHDLGVVRAISDRTAVMYRGKVVEVGPTPEVLTRPVHPYAQSLLWSASAAGRSAMSDEARTALANEPSAMSADAGCVFRTRCWRAVDDCATGVTRHDLSEAHWADCNVPLRLPAETAVGGEKSVPSPRGR